MTEIIAVVQSGEEDAEGRPRCSPTATWKKYERKFGKARKQVLWGESEENGVFISRTGVWEETSLLSTTTWKEFAVRRGSTSFLRMWQATEHEATVSSCAKTGSD